MPVLLNPVKKVDDNFPANTFKSQLLYFSVFLFFHESYKLNESILVSQNGILTAVALTRKILGKESA
jgi:hypothetical protein